jgi:hypothetical protein
LCREQQSDTARKESTYYDILSIELDRQDMDILFEEGVLRVKGERKEPQCRYCPAIFSP